jgi:hypothetical protein
MLTNVSSGSSVIVYRSEGEAIMDQWLYNDGGIIYIFAACGIVVGCAFLWSKIEPLFRRRK